MTSALGAPRDRPGLLSMLLVIAGVILAVAALREDKIAVDELAAARAAAQARDWVGAVEHGRACAQAYVPWTRAPDEGLALLASVARDAEGRADRPMALLAWGALRTAALSVRGLGVDRSEWRTQAEEGLARLASTFPAPHSPEAGPLTLAALRRDGRPSPGSSFWLAASVWLAIAALALHLRRDPPSRRPWLIRAALAAGVVLYAFVILRR